MKNDKQQLSFTELLHCVEEETTKHTSVPLKNGRFPDDLIADFDIFLSYCQEHPVALTKKNEYISRKHLVKLNALMNVKAADATLYSDQDRYPYLHFLFNLSQSSRLLQKNHTGLEIQLIGTERISMFKDFSECEKYCSLLEAFWVDTDWTSLKKHSQNPAAQISSVFATFCNAPPGKKWNIASPITETDQFVNSQTEEWHYFHLYFEWFGLWSCQDDTKRIEEYYRNDCYFAKTITLTPLGYSIMSVLIFERNPEAWNIAHRRVNGESEWFPGMPLETFNGFFTTDSDYNRLAKTVQTDQSNQPFHQPFVPFFPSGELIRTLPREQKRFNEGTYTFKVLFSNDVWRKLVLSGDSTMHDLHNSIIRSYQFGDDHLYSFFMDGKKWSDNCIASPDDDFGHRNSEKVRIDSLCLQLGQKFLYLFDYGDEWVFNVLVEDINTNNTDAILPYVSAEKGLAPEQYFDFEEEDEWE
ncbi:plasmid pRiA4b ORF-3 family protein [Sporosarcina sp. FA9]|uniref:plasmid pRiA4b ORF-3 family protein n=1 Tax=Sporosarcina sp. FA9 TaxID=3413030 RepID=UPI003F6605D8